jgi:MarR family 2-MHQ and catechol resistance regulon transcriptional repressor
MLRSADDRVKSRDATLDRDARELHKAVAELVRVYQFRDRKRICYYDISVTQCYALGALVAAGPMTLNALAGELFLDKSTASRTVDALEKKGYVMRSTNPGDARALKIEITAGGQHLHDRILQDLYEQTRALAADFDSKERRATTEFIERFTRKAAARFRGEAADRGEGE